VAITAYRPPSGGLFYFLINIIYSREYYFLFRRQPTKPNAEQEGKNYGKSDPDISAQIMRVLSEISLGISVELVRVLNPIDPEKYRRT